MVRSKPHVETWEQRPGKRGPVKADVYGVRGLVIMRWWFQCGDRGSAIAEGPSEATAHHMWPREDMLGGAVGLGASEGLEQRVPSESAV